MRYALAAERVPQRLKPLSTWSSLARVELVPFPLLCLARLESEPCLLRIHVRSRARVAPVSGAHLIGTSGTRALPASLFGEARVRTVSFLLPCLAGGTREALTLPTSEWVRSCRGWRSLFADGYPQIFHPRTGYSGIYFAARKRLRKETPPNEDESRDFTHSIGIGWFI